MINVREIITRLLASEEPSIRYKTRINVLEEASDSASIRQLQEEIRTSPRVKTLLRSVDGEGRLLSYGNVYDKWQGAHWVLATLADIGYPPGDTSLLPVKEQLLAFWLSDFYYTEFQCDNKAKSYRQEGVPVMQGRHRRCAAQQGNALFSIVKLGLDGGSRTELKNGGAAKLAERLLHWQWPDGGWNCDRNPAASHSSFMETLIPLRGLALYAREYPGHPDSAVIVRAVGAAAEVFLRRHLYKRATNAELIDPEFIRLHYPLYWHYDILGGLKTIAEAGLIGDSRCSDALDLLESKCLPNGGWASEKRYYTVSESFKSGMDYVEWGDTGKNRVNEWVTADALYVLKKAGRI